MVQVHVWRFVSSLLLTTALIAVVQSQIPLPKRPLGFVYKGGEPSAHIHVEAFIDLTCPDCQQAWPTVKKVADMYGPQTVQLTLQLFPLPFHTNAFVAAQVSLDCLIIVPADFPPNTVCTLMSFIFIHLCQLCGFRKYPYPP